MDGIDLLGRHSPELERHRHRAKLPRRLGYAQPRARLCKRAPANRLDILTRMFSMLRRRHQSPEISVGARYFRRDAPSIVWEVLSLYVGIDGLAHAILFDVGHHTLRKTLSKFTLENSGQYTRVPES